MDPSPRLGNIEKLILLTEAEMNCLSGCESGIADQPLLVCHVVERTREKCHTLLLSSVVGKEADARYSTQERALPLAWAASITASDDMDE